MWRCPPFHWSSQTPGDQWKLIWISPRAFSDYTIGFFSNSPLKVTWFKLWCDKIWDMKFPVVISDAHRRFFLRGDLSAWWGLQRSLHEPRNRFGAVMISPNGWMLCFFHGVVVSYESTSFHNDFIFKTIWFFGDSLSNFSWKYPVSHLWLPGEEPSKQDWKVWKKKSAVP